MSCYRQIFKLTAQLLIPNIYNVGLGIFLEAKYFPEHQIQMVKSDFFSLIYPCGTSFFLFFSFF